MALERARVASSSQRLLDLVRWLPAAVAAAYVATVVLLFPGLVRDLYWDSDAASWLVLAQPLRERERRSCVAGPVEVPNEAREKEDAGGGVRRRGRKSGE